MTPLQFECFFEVLKTNSFSLAADNLYMSQPTLSRQIIGLEEELGVSLFVRAKNTIWLSEEGSVLLPYLEQLRRHSEEDREAIMEAAKKLKISLRIGIQEGQRPNDIICHALRKIKEAHPDADISLRSVNLNNSYRLCSEGKLDALLCLENAMILPEYYRFKVVEEDSMCVAVPIEHPNAYLDEINIVNLKETFAPLNPYGVDFEAAGIPQVEHDKRLDPWLDQMDLKTVYDFEDAHLTVMAGMGMAFINWNSALGMREDVRLLPIYIEEDGKRDYVKINCGVIWNSYNSSCILKEFLELL